MLGHWPTCLGRRPIRAGACPKRNGGRHCCQPPLRRAKDLPVFASLGPAPENRLVTPLLDPGSPAQASLSIRPLPLARSRTCLLDYVARRLAGLSPVRPAIGPKSSVKTVRCSAALLGSATLASRFAPSAPKCLRSRVALEKDQLFRRHLPGWPRFRSEEPLHCLPAEIGSSVPSSPFAPLPAFRGDWDFRPDHLSTMRLSPESGKRKMWGEACG